MAVVIIFRPQQKRAIKRVPSVGAIDPVQRSLLRFSIVLRPRAARPE